MTMIPRIALTPGEPAGIGPDLCVMLAQQDYPAELVAVANPDLLLARAKRLNLPLNLVEFNPDAPINPYNPGELGILPVKLAKSVQPGQLDPLNSRYVLKTISKAVRGCLNNWFAAMVTAPVHKGIINDAGYAFTGHTEYIAGITTGSPVMMLATPGLRVALVTIHMPLQQVSQAITRSKLRQIIRVLHHDLQNRFHLSNPKILVCGLNPHAGEGGHLGREEIEVIAPVIQTFIKQGVDLEGPLPADTIFTPKYLERADAILAMYHDQGLPVLKYMGFGRAANITLGLPIIRTSVDHGTALDLAGTGLADAGSLRYALETALLMSQTNAT